MSFKSLTTETDISEDWPDDSNENWRKERFKNTESKSASFTAWADDTTGSPRDLYYCDASSSMTATLPSVAVGDGILGRETTIYREDDETATGSGTLTVQCATGQEMDGIGSSTTIVKRGDSITLVGRTTTRWAVLRRRAQ